MPSELPGHQVDFLQVYQVGPETSYYYISIDFTFVMQHQHNFLGSNTVDFILPKPYKTAEGLFVITYLTNKFVP